MKSLVLLNMEFKLTAVFKKVPAGYIGFVQELPGANTQGQTLARNTREPSRSDYTCSGC